jgi:hypothetical protein
MSAPLPLLYRKGQVITCKGSRGVILALRVSVRDVHGEQIVVHRARIRWSDMTRLDSWVDCANLEPDR